MTEEKKTEEEKKEVSLYEKFASRSRELVDEAREKTSETVDAAIEKAKEEMVAAGDFGREQGEKFKAFLQRDLHTARIVISKTGVKAMDMLEPHRVAAGIQGTLATILEVLGDRFEEWAKKLESHLDYKTGEMTTPGTLTCKSCKSEIKMQSTSHIPPCPKCRSTEFKKSY